MSTLLQRIYPERQNVADMKVYYIEDNGELSLLDLTPVVRVVVTLLGANAGGNVVLDSAQGDDVTWDSDGNIKYKFYGKTVDEGEFPLTVILYDASHTPAGQYIAHPRSKSRIIGRVING